MPAFSMIDPNASGVVSWPSTLTDAVSSCAEPEGAPPMVPAVTVAFWAVMALATSAGFRLYSRSLTGSSQIRSACDASLSCADPHARRPLQFAQHVTSQIVA